MNKVIHSRPATSLKSVFLVIIFTTLIVNLGWGQITLRGSSTALIEYSKMLTINKPASVAQGDIMIASISVLDHCACNISDITCSGWTLIPGVLNVGGGTAKHCTILYKIATNAEPASYSFTSPATGCISSCSEFYSVGGIVAFAGVDPVSPFDAIGTMNSQLSNSPTNSLIAPSITTSTDNCAVVLFGMESYYTGGYNTHFSAWSTTTSPGSLNEVFDISDYYVSVGAAWALMAAHGVTGNGTATLTGSATWGAILIALKPKSALPVSLLNFTGDCISGSKTLSWSTASETNNNFFVIERSTDKSNWTIVGKVTGAVNSNTFQQYSFTDYAAESDNIYYRLTQVDFDGASETFNAIAVHCETNNPDISCYPNPFNDQLVIGLQNMEAIEGEIRLIDVTGRTIIYKELTASELAQNTIELSLPDMANGVYSLEFRADNYVKTMRVVKNQ